MDKTESQEENPKGLSPEMIKEEAAKIADRLDEESPNALAQIERTIERLGLERAEAFLQQAFEVEAQGGLMTNDGSRRRTLGGVYLYLIKSQISKRDRYFIWPIPKTPKLPKFEWRERLAVAPEVLPYSGRARMVKITLLGRPGRIVEKGGVVLTTMQSRRPPSLPKAMPDPPKNLTTYVVYISRRQWRRVSDVADDVNDILIVEGYPTFDERIKTVAVFSIHVTTRKLQAAKREAQRRR